MDAQGQIAKRMNTRMKKNPKGWIRHLKDVQVEDFKSSCTRFSTEELFATPVIYFLEHNGIVVYVGQTESLMARISQHFVENTKIFTRFSFIVFLGGTRERMQAEKKYIKELKPIYNKTHNG